MGSKERRERQKAETRQRILDAARELFAHYGYENVTMRKIAEAIEYSPTAIYLHFADKDTLMRELSVCDFIGFSDRFREVPETADPVERLRGFGHAYLQFAQACPNQYRLLFMSPHPPEGVQPPPEVIEDGAYEQLVAVVRQAMQAGAFHPGWKDEDVIAQLFWTSLHGIVSLHQVMKDPAKVRLVPANELAEVAVTMLMTALRLPPTAPQG